MAYEPLHHKYRPQNFSQLKGQEAIAQTLTNALNSAKIAPAYLFSGPRGTGKTSSARILAKSLNCLTSDRPTATPCGECEVCQSINNGSALDVIEIDAASNTGVDNIREIIERSQFAPVKCRYKVYVIDECHMLSTAAFNALLKTLEEPPPRVIFVLATTDPQRVLPTIISRCQRFDYRRIPLEAMVKQLSYIAQQEQIDIDDEALYLVAQLANGGMRDGESLLDQLSLLSGTITASQVWDLVGAVSEQDLLALLEAIATDEVQTVITKCRQLLDRGREPLIVLQNLANFYLNLLIAKTSPQRQDLVAVTTSTWQRLCQLAPQWQLNTILQGQKKLKDSEVQIRNTTQPRLWLEITLLNLLPSAIPQATTPISPQSGNPQTTTQSLATNPPQTLNNQNISDSTPHSRPTTPPPSEQPKEVSPITPDSVTSNSNPPSPTTPTNSGTQFNSLEELQELVASHCPLLTREFFKQNCCLISFNNNRAEIGVKTANLLNIAKNNPNFKKEFESAFSIITQQQVTVIFKLDNSGKHSTYPSSKPNNESKPAHNPPPQSSPVVNQNNNSTNQQNTSISSDNHKSSSFKDQFSTKSASSRPSSTSSPKSESAKPNPSSPTPENVSEKKLKHLEQKSAESLAKSFNGEIIFTESKPETIVKIKKVTNRPTWDNLPDDEIPF